MSLSTHAKAIVAFITSLIGGLVIVITGDEGFSDVTTNEWLVVAGDTIVTTAAVWFVPNKEISA